MEHEYESGDLIFDNILVLEKFGGKDKSGFGVVYLVIDIRNGFQFALKTLQKEKISLNDFDEFKKEFIPWIELSNHPNIIWAYTVDLDKNNRPYLLIEPVFPDEQGRQCLNDYLDEQLSELQILKWCIQFCYAMDYINENDYIHGDIKPNNILIDNGIIKITDFGLVKNINDSTNEYNGTPYYLAPESWDGNKSIASDIYSFGMVMYQMINLGELPFDGITHIEWEEFHKNGEIPSLDSDLFSLIKKCLNKNSKNRFLSFSELNNELIELLDEKYHQKINKPELEDIGNITNLNKGHLAAILKDVENCKKYYEIAISNSNDKLTIYNYALDLISLNEYSDALYQLKRLLNNQDTIPLERIYFNIGKCYHEGICLYKSIEYYRDRSIILF